MARATDLKPEVACATGLTPEEAEERYGEVIRVLGPGESFGELALLNRSARRTATILAAPNTQGRGPAAGESCFAAQVETCELRSAPL